MSIEGDNQLVDKVENTLPSSQDQYTAELTEEKNNSDTKSTSASFEDAIDDTTEHKDQKSNEFETDAKNDDFLDDYISSKSAEAAASNEPQVAENTPKITEKPNEPLIDEKMPVTDTSEEISKSLDTLTKPVEEPLEKLQETKIKPALPPRDEKADTIHSPADLNIYDMTSIDSEENDSVVHHDQGELSTTTYPKDKPNDDSKEKPIITPTSKWFNFDKSSVDFNKTANEISSPPNMNLAYNRYQDKELELEMKSASDKSDVRNSRNSLKQTFNEIKTGVTLTQNSELLHAIDWEFWSEVFNDYSNIVKNKQNQLKINITNGIPKEIRGMAWQIICDSNSMKLKEFFINTKNIKSNFEKLIRRDLARTSFIKDSAVKEKIDDLFNIIKTYSLYDEEVGYTQGMAFITVPLLMNMESDEAFCMLVRLMFTYGFREFYLPDMPGLHLRIYQFDRLIEDTLPDLNLHLKNQNIKSSMYALQWFLTLFAYKFPLDMVLRIYDVVIAEGLESILKFALNLMIQNHDHLLTLTFDDLLNFLKEKLFYCYLELPISPNKEKELEKHDFDEEGSGRIKYQVDRFIKDSMEIDILPITLNKYSAEFDEIDKLEKQREKQVRELQSTNGLLTKEIRKIEASYALLNKEHVEIATEMVNGKVQIGSLEEENQALKEEIEQLKNRLANLTSQKNVGGNVDFTGKLSEGLDEEIQNAMDINLKVMDENTTLEDTLAKLEEEHQILSANAHKKTPKLGSMFGLKKTGKFW